MTENFAAFEYKSQEEVLTVIRHITSVLSVAGVNVVDILSKKPMLGDLSVCILY